MNSKTKQGLLIAASLLLAAGSYTAGSKLYSNGRVAGCSQLIEKVVPAVLEPACKLVGGQLAVTARNPANLNQFLTLDIETGALLE